MHQTPPQDARAWAQLPERGGYARTLRQHLSIAERQTDFTVPGAPAPGQFEDEK